MEKSKKDPFVQGMNFEKHPASFSQIHPTHHTHLNSYEPNSENSACTCHTGSCTCQDKKGL